MNKFSIFYNYEFSHEPTLSEVIKAIGWGSNRDIRQKGFKVLLAMDWPYNIKYWDRITDPYYKIYLPTLVAKPKGQSILAVFIKEAK